MLHPPKVLVVDDDENILSAFNGFLKSEGCEMLAARTTQEAKKKVEHHRVKTFREEYVELLNEHGIEFDEQY